MYLFKRDKQHDESSCVSGDDLKTDGFSIESCRSMVAVMDVSFLSLGDFMCLCNRGDSMKPVVTAQERENSWL